MDTPDSSKAPNPIQIYGGDLLARLMSAYVQDAEEMLANAKTALAARDWTAVAKAARILHRAAEILFCDSVCTHAKALAKAAETRMLDDARGIIERLEQAHARFLVELTAQLQMNEA